MRKYLGIPSILVLVLTGFAWYSLYSAGSYLHDHIPKRIWNNGGMFYCLLIFGYSAAGLACWFKAAKVRLHFFFRVN